MILFCCAYYFVVVLFYTIPIMDSIPFFHSLTHSLAIAQSCVSKVLSLPKMTIWTKKNVSCFSWTFINLKSERDKRVHNQNIRPYAKILQNEQAILMCVHLTWAHFFVRLGLYTHLFNEKKISVMMRTNCEQSILSVERRNSSKSFIVCLYGLFGTLAFFLA